MLHFMLEFQAVEHYNTPASGVEIPRSHGLSINTNMKKTLITLFALAACAQAVEPVVYDNLLGTTDGWTMGSDRDRNLFVVNTADKTLTLTNSNWGQSYATCTLDETLSHNGYSNLSFSVTMNSGDAKSYSFALVGTENAIVIGSNYDGKLLYGVSDNITASAYSFTANFDRHSNALVDGTELTTTFAANTDYVISGVSSFDTDTQSLTLTLSINNSETAVISGLSLVNVDKLVFTGDGANNTTNVTVSNLSITGVPEPATATLSLLALAGLAARRRRH